MRSARATEALPRSPRGSGRDAEPPCRRPARAARSTVRTRRWARADAPARRRGSGGTGSTEMELARRPPFLSLDTSTRDWHRASKPVAEASQGRSLSLSRCGARRASRPVASIRSEVSLRQDIEREAAAAGAAVPALTRRPGRRRAAACGHTRPRAERRDPARRTPPMSQRAAGQSRRGHARSVAARRSACRGARAPDRDDGGDRATRARGGIVDAAERAPRQRAPDPDRRRRRELRGAAERRARRRGAAAEEPQHRRAANGWRGARDGHRARRRRASPGARGDRASAGSRRARPLGGPRGRAAARVASAPDPARDPSRERGDDSCARPARGGERRPDARARRGWRRPLRPRIRVAREGARTRGGESRPARCLQPAESRARRPRGGRTSSPALLALFTEKGLEVRGAVDGAEPLDRPLGHEWASDPERVATVTIALVDGLDDAVRVANEQTSGLAAGIVAEDEEAAMHFLDAYRGTAAYWHATTRFTDGFELTGAPETGINVDWAPGPRGPVTYRDLWLRQYRIVGDGTDRDPAVTVVVKLGSSLVAGRGRNGSPDGSAPPRDRDRGDRQGWRVGRRRLVGRDRARPAAAGPRAAPACAAEAAGGLGARAVAPAAGVGAGACA